MSRKQNVSEELLDILAEAGARQIFGITGDALNPFLEAIRKDHRFQWIGVRHEENAAYAACAQAQLSGGIGVCAGSSGPGALHLINGLYTAKMERVGVVAITGQVSRAERSTGFHKEVDLPKMFDDVCAYQAPLLDASQMPRVAQIAVQKALNERVVVRVELPIDLVDAEVPSQHFRHRIVDEDPKLTPHPEGIDEAARVINRGKRVALFCGIGCREAKEEVYALASKLRAPIVQTFKAKDVFDYEDPHVVGMTGLIGNPPGYHAIKECDVLVMLGTDFPYDEFLPDGIEIVQIDSLVEHIGRRAPVTVGLVGHVKPTLAALNPLVESKSDDKFLDVLTRGRDKWLSSMADQASLNRTDEPLHPQIFAKEISDRADPDAIFAVGVGDATIWVARQVSLAGDRRHVCAFNHGAVGSSLPLALGAIALHPAREVWALCGDLDFGMSMQAFITAVRYEWPLKVIVFNNSEMSFVKLELEVAGLPMYDEATGLTNPDFAAYAKACGGEGIRVEHAEDIVPAIERARASDAPFIIDAVVSSGELSMPPHIDVKMAWGFGISKVKEALLGFEGDHKQWANMKKELKALR